VYGNAGVMEQGFYFKVGGDFFGMYHTSEGPKLFFNKDKYKLRDNCWDVELVIGQKNNLFAFYWKGEMKISFRCSKHQDFILSLFNLLQQKSSRQQLA
jgi:hypothetical protein